MDEPATTVDLDKEREVRALVAMIGAARRHEPIRRLEAYEQLDHEAEDCSALVVWAMQLHRAIRCNRPATHEAGDALLCTVHVKALKTRDLTISELGEFREIDFGTEAVALA